ncbi:MAG TPA: 3-methyl-2-oxobutanoate hydroxymethyltransferase [Acidobacteriota bacterium]|nr:3-methyl-2-oxobutanoate hydroxymethyltransferase [Acidobacteriota bacterium]HNT99229.1 3-methyl-2-oxobutanoate hydroxymethyltransferase [Acidobacteriota bacterium]HQO25668.1 3-methyl-2-oxobutanoate hydroxymethyltransferase [Acidobacteriota bacterium]
MAKKHTVCTIRQKKSRGEKITALTAYDFPTARIVDDAGMDIVLVGDSLGMVVQGESSTLPVDMAAMLYHTRIVRRAVRSALLVADLPFGAYQESSIQAVHNSIRLVKESGAEGVKLEGGRRRLPAVTAILDAEIPVMGHLGLTPQSFHRLGGYRIQGRTVAEIENLIEDALALQAAGCFAVVLEGIPHPVAAIITRQLEIPTIGIGSGPACDGQILVLHDMLGLGDTPPFKFVRSYARLAEEMIRAVQRYGADVVAGSFPSIDESFTLDPEVQREVEGRYGTHHQDQ